MAMDLLNCDEVEFSWDNANSLPNVASADWMGREVKLQKDSGPEKTFQNLRPLSLLAFTNSQLAGRVNLNAKLSKEDGLEAVLCYGTYGSQKPSASGEVGLVGTWGGKEGGKCSIYGEAKVEDKRGNTAQARVTCNNDGTGEIRASVKVKTEDE